MSEPIYYSRENAEETYADIIRKAIYSLHRGQDSYCNKILLDGLGINTRDIASVVDDMGGDVDVIAQRITEGLSKIKEKYSIRESDDKLPSTLIEFSGDALRKGHNEVPAMINYMKKSKKSRIRNFVDANCGLIDGAVELDWARQIPDENMNAYLKDLGEIYRASVREYKEPYYECNEMTDLISRLRHSRAVKSKGIGVITEYLTPDEISVLKTAIEAEKTKGQVDNKEVSPSEIAEADKANAITTNDIQEVKKGLEQPSKDGEVK